MEKFTTYEFYKDTYCGDTIDESAFYKWEARAEDKLLFLTCGNITEGARIRYEMPIQKAVCALADLLFEMDAESRKASSNGEENIKSRSSGGESVTYGNTDTLVTKVLADKKAQNRLMYDTVAEYLSGTGLLYAGV